MEGKLKLPKSTVGNGKSKSKIFLRLIEAVCQFREVARNLFVKSVRKELIDSILVSLNTPKNKLMPIWTWTDNSSLNKYISDTNHPCKRFAPTPHAQLWIIRTNQSRYQIKSFDKSFKLSEFWWPTPPDKLLLFGTVSRKGLQPKDQTANSFIHRVLSVNES